MAVFYQIFGFYMLMGLVMAGLVGYYPKMDPNFAQIPLFADHPAFHMKIGKISSMALMFLQVLAIVFALVLNSKIKAVFKESDHGFQDLHKVKKTTVLTIVLAIITLLLAKMPWLMGTLLLKGKMSASAHFHANSSFFIFLSISFVFTGYYLEKLSRTLYFMRLEASHDVKPMKFLWDEHARGFSLALKFLFLGINVWWPYLVLKYGFGLKALSGLYFLPVHLAGVLPFSFMKRKHKFKRTVHPHFEGKIKKKDLYKIVTELPDSYQLRAL